MRAWIINLAVCAGLLCRTLFPGFLQAHYFECASCLYLTFVICALVFAIVFVLIDPKEARKQKRNPEWYNFQIEIRNCLVALVSIFTSHYIIGVTFLFLTWILSGLLENARGARK